MNSKQLKKAVVDYANHQIYRVRTLTHYSEKTKDEITKEGNVMRDKIFQAIDDNYKD